MKILKINIYLHRVVFRKTPFFRKINHRFSVEVAIISLSYLNFLILQGLVYRLVDKHAPSLWERMFNRASTSLSRTYHRVTARRVRHCYTCVRITVTSRVPANERRSVHAARSCSDVVTVPPRLLSPPPSRPPRRPFPSCVPSALLVDTIDEQLYPAFTSGASDFTRLQRCSSNRAVNTASRACTAIDTLSISHPLSLYLVANRTRSTRYRDSDVIWISPSLWNVNTIRMSRSDRYQRCLAMVNWSLFTRGRFFLRSISRN